MTIYYTISSDFTRVFIKIYIRFANNSHFCELPGEKFALEPHLGSDKSPAVQVFENACVGGKCEFQLVGIEKLLFVSERFIKGVAAVFAVAEQGMADAGEMRPYLMSPAREQLDLNEAQAAVLGEDGVLRAYLLCATVRRSLTVTLFFFSSLVSQPSSTPLFCFMEPWITQR